MGKGHQRKKRYLSHSVQLCMLGCSVSRDTISNLSIFAWFSLSVRGLMCGGGLVGGDCDSVRGCAV